MIMIVIKVGVHRTLERNCNHVLSKAMYIHLLELNIIFVIYGHLIFGLNLSWFMITSVRVKKTDLFQNNRFCCEKLVKL